MRKRTYLGNTSMAANTMDESDTSKGTAASTGSNITMSEAEHMQSLPTMPPKPKTITPQMADALLAETMNQMTIQDRQQVYEDIHGVSENPIIDLEENEMKGGGPKFVVRCLQELNEEIDSLPNSQKQAYLMAIGQDMEYVMSLRIMFLRSEVYNVPFAAARLCAFLEFKLELFGVEKLARDILWSDLTQTDIDCLRTGYMQLLPGRDRSGRSILFFNRGNTTEEQGRFRNMPVESRLRVTIYFVMKMLQDINTQKNGVVSVSYDAGPRRKEFSMNDQIYTWKSGKLISVLPFRVMSMHYCYMDPLTDMLLALAKTVLGARTRARLRPHCGKHLELMYELMTYGISPDMFPIDIRGDECVTTTKNHEVFLDRLQREDEEELLFAQQQQEVIQEQLLEPKEIDDDHSDLMSLSDLLLSSPLIADDIDLDGNYEEDSNNRMDNSPALVSLVGSTCNLDAEAPQLTQIEVKSTNILARDDMVDEKKMIQPKDQPNPDHRAKRLRLEKPKKKRERKKKNNKVQEEPQRVSEPTDSDVLLGRGNIGVHKSNPGNVRFQQLMDKYEDQYESEDRFGKTVVAGMIVDAIKQGNGRFLRQDENGWIVISDTIARTRVGHNFRNRRIKRVKQNKKNGGGNAGSKGKDNRTSSSILSAGKFSSDDDTNCNLFSRCS